MATITVVSVLDRVNTILVDVTKTRWTYEELIVWFNDAVLAVVNKRPDANVQNTSYTLTANQSKQILPTNGLRWIDVIFNEATGSPIRKTIRRQLDDQIPNWHRRTGTEPTQYVFDERDPKVIYVYPQVTTAQSVLACYSIAPTAIDIADIATAIIPIDDNYVNPLVDFILYRAYSKDADYAANAQRAMGHLQAFGAELGDKYQVDKAYNPRSRMEELNNG
jgi:hypothetical protein